MTNDSLRRTFDAVPEIYDRVRPEHPAAAFDALLAYVRERRDCREIEAVEIGPGTGQATKALLARGVRVTAAEIGPRLARFLSEKFAGEPRLRVYDEAFEELDLPLSSYDLVFAANSFHWVEHAVRYTKPHALLRPGGVLATLSMIQVRSGADRGYFHRTHEIYARYGEPAAKPGDMTPEPDEAAPPEYRELLTSPLFGDVTLRRYPWDQTYDTAAYTDLMRSYSNMQAMDADARESLIAELGAVIDREYDGRVTRPLVVALVMARKR